MTSDTQGSTMRKTTKTALSSSRVEKDVENAYRAEISAMRPSALWTSPHGCDGYAVWGATGTVPTPVRLLTEFKNQVNLKDRLVVLGVLGQAILYLKKFEAAGQVLPNVILIGDKDECLVLSTESIKGFLTTDWKGAPSGGCPELTRALVAGFGVLPYTYDVSKLDFQEVLLKIEHLAAGVGHSVRVTSTNVSAIFQDWVDRVFRDKSLSAADQVDVFLRCLFKQEVELSLARKSILIVPGYEDGVKVDQGAFTTFFEQFQRGYSASEIESFYANKDRLMEDTARRRQGAFFTPKIWVDEAHKEIEKALGPNWKEECIVWDPAAGTANLTRDYSFKNLIISTAERADVQVIKDQKYNEGASVFQYDFLNPGAPSPFFEAEEQDRNVLPSSVVKKLEEAAKAGKRLVFFMNPPYGTSADFGLASKAGVSDTLTQESMKTGGLGPCRDQLYAQFMWRATEWGFKNVTVAMFSKPNFISAASYSDLRAFWYRRFSFRTGMLFQASQFADVSGAWGVSFTVWSEGVTPVSSDIHLSLCEVKDFRVQSQAQKALYSSEGRQASQWVRPGATSRKFPDSPKFSDGLSPRESRHGEEIYNMGSDPNALFIFINSANNLQQSQEHVSAAPGKPTHSKTCHFDVSPGEHFRKVVALYAARKLVEGTWINDKDEYLIPDVTLSGYEQWVDDCHIYALSHRYNNCTAMRDVMYKGKSFRIKNHFFWKTQKETLALLDRREGDTNTLYRDCKNEPRAHVMKSSLEDDILGLQTTPTEPFRIDGDPYLASVLPSLQLSQEAQDVLRILNELWVKSLPIREKYSDGKPELHLMCWDAGIYQLKHLWRDCFPVEWKELQAAHKVLAAKLQPGVYDYGFLRR